MKFFADLPYGEIVSLSSSEARNSQKNDHLNGEALNAVNGTLQKKIFICGITISSDT